MEQSFERIYVLGMATADYNITLKQGASWTSEVISVVDEDGDPVDLSGFEGTSQIRASIGAADVITTMDVAIGGADMNEVTFSITSENAALLTAGFEGEYDVKLASGPEVYYVVQGRVLVRGKVTA